MIYITAHMNTQRCTHKVTDDAGLDSNKKQQQYTLIAALVTTDNTTVVKEH